MIKVTAKKGQLIWFHGTLPHGRTMTYKAVDDDCEWKPAIHGHLDDSHHHREQGSFDFEFSEDVYFPLSHSKFMTDLIPVLNLGEDIIYVALTEIMSRKKGNCQLTTMQGAGSDIQQTSAGCTVL